MVLCYDPTRRWVQLFFFVVCRFRNQTLIDPPLALFHPSSHTQHLFCTLLHLLLFVIYYFFFIPGSRGCWRDGCDVQVGCKKSCARRSWFRSIWFTKFCATSNSQQRVDDWCWQRVYRHHSATVDTGSFLSTTRVLVLDSSKKRKHISSGSYKICCCRTHTQHSLNRRFKKFKIQLSRLSQDQNSNDQEHRCTFLL